VYGGLTWILKNAKERREEQRKEREEGMGEGERAKKRRQDEKIKEDKILDI